MANRIDQVIQEVRRTQHVTYRELARRCGIPEPTLHSARRRETIDGLSIDTFIHIAHGLGLTAEQLYSGEDSGNKYADPRQAEINEVFDSVTEQGKDVMWTNAIMARNTFLENGGGNTVQTAI
jgi:transcriptional regulator with XRE-family HTH domain